MTETKDQPRWIAYPRLWGDMLRRCWRQAPGMTALTLTCHLLNTFAFAGIGLALGFLVDGAVEGDTTAVLIGALGAAAAFALDWAVREIALMLTIHLGDRVGLTDVEPEIMGMCTRVERMQHLERPEFLNRVTTVRGEGWAIVESSWSALLSALFMVRVLLTVLLLGSVNGLLAFLLLYAVFQLWIESYGRRKVTKAELAIAEDIRLQRHLFQLAVNPASLKELRTSGAGDTVLRTQREVWDRAVDARARAIGTAALWSSGGQIIYAVGFTVIMAFVITGGSSPGEIVLAVTVGAQLRGAVEMAVQRSSQAALAKRVIDPYLWLRSHAREEEAERARTQGREVPDRLRQGITLDEVTFGYPETDRPAVDRVSAHLPAGSVVAVVGEHGSGKTTLVKLLSRFHRPDSGTILIDGHDLQDLPSSGWWPRMSAVFQDFGRYLTTFRQSVRLGGMEQDARDVERAVADADATKVAEGLPDGLDTQLGKRFGGVELSEGQWQKVALARSSMRTDPLLFVLDEPTASLDAPSEQEIFDHHIGKAGARARRTGTVTVIVSHRFSTVSSADLILVMRDGQLVESGAHQELISLGGVYAELYRLQERAYEK